MQSLPLGTKYRDFSHRFVEKNGLKFSLKKLPVKNFSFHGCLFKIVHAHFFFHGLKSAQLITPGFTPNFDVQIDHGLIFASRALFCELITGGK